MGAESLYLSEPLRTVTLTAGKLKLRRLTDSSVYLRPDVLLTPRCYSSLNYVYMHSVGSHKNRELGALSYFLAKVNADLQIML